MTRTNWCERLSSHAVSTGKAFRNLLALSSSAGSCVAICAVLAGICQGPVAQAQNISTVVGNGTSSYSGDGGPATSAALNQPFGIAFDASGNLYIADQYNCLIREVSGGIITTIAGNTSGAPNCGYSGDGGPATSAQLNLPTGVTLDSSGNLYIVDYGNCVVRKVNGGTITTIAGSASGCGYSGDGGPATSAQLQGPVGLTLDSSGNLYIADTYNCLIREVSGGVITTVAGNSSGAPNCGYSGDGGPATSAQLNDTYGIAIDSAGNLYIADEVNCLVREVSGGIITAIAGNTSGVPNCWYTGDGAPATTFDLSFPQGITPDPSGNLYIADTLNCLIREVSSGTITTVAGNTTGAGPGDNCAYSGDGGPATSAQLSSPRGTALDAYGNLYISDSFNSVIRFVLSPGSITIASNLNPSAYNQAVTFTATINEVNGDVKHRVTRRKRSVKSQDVTGSVAWSDNTGCGTTPVTSGNPGVATCVTTILNVGSDTVTGTYSGDANHGDSAASMNQVVNVASQTINVTFIPTTATPKSSFTVMATGGGSGNALAYMASGGCTNSGATYTMAMTGHAACDVIINQAGNGNYTAAPQVTDAVTVAAAVVPTKSLTGPSTAFYESTYNVTATSDSFSVPTLTATPATVCTISGTTVTMIDGTGICTAKATWAANYEYAAATAILATHAERVPSTVHWSNPAAITYGTPLSATQQNATATDPNNNPIPGTFAYTPVAGKILMAGSQTLKVKFTPTQTTDYTTVAGTEVTIVVNPVGTTTAITSSSANPSTVDATVTFDFTVTQAISNPTTAPGMVTLTASTGETCHGALASGAGHCNIKFTTSGARTLSASYPGNANNQASTSAPFTQTVN